MRTTVIFISLSLIVGVSYCYAQHQSGPCKTYSEASIDHAFSYFDNGNGADVWGDSLTFIFEILELSQMKALEEWAINQEFRLKVKPSLSYNLDDKRPAHLMTLSHKGLVGDRSQIAEVYKMVSSIKEKLGISDCGIAKVKMRPGHPVHPLPEGVNVQCPDPPASK